MTGGDLRAWRSSPAVKAFAESATHEPGGLLRFDDMPPATLRALIADGPETLADQASGDGPRLAVMLDLAERFEGVLGGFLSAADRDDIFVFCDTLTVPTVADENVVADLDPDEVTVLDDGRRRLWWD